MTTSSYMRRLGAMLKAPGTRLLERAAGEREIGINRLAFGCAVLAYQGVMGSSGLTSPTLVAVNVGYLLAGTALFLDVRWHPQRSPLRRYLSLCLDVGVVTVALSLWPPYMVPFFPLYTWILLGYAFRYGISYLRAASILSLIGFLAVVATTPFWSEQPFVVAGVIGCLVCLPLYTEALLRKALAATEMAQASNRAKAFILSCLSHELRTPLSAVIAVADQLGGTTLDPEQKAMLDTMRGSTRSILADMDNLLDVSRIEAGHTTVVPTEFSILGLVEEIVALVGVEARAKGVQLGLHVTASTPIFVETDRRHLGKVLLNLVQNAVRFTSVGSVLVSVDSRTIGIASVLLRMEVLDTGIGIPRQARASIFEAYSQADEEVLRQHRGTGLGLSIARQLVELLGGRIGVESDVGTGSAFWIEVPIQARTREHRPDLAGTGIILLSQEPTRVQPLASRMAQLGAKTFVVDRSDRISAVLASGMDDCRRITVVLDGQGVDPVAVALAMGQNALFGRVPLILLAGAQGLPPSALRHHYVTAISAASSDEEIWTALQIVGLLEENPESAMNADSSPAEQPAAPRPLRILVADGNRTSQVVLTQLLSHAGHWVRAVGDGEAALDALDREDYDLAIMDLDMPVMNGADAAQIYRVVSLGRSHLPIIGLTADRAADGERRCAGASMDACLTKPVNRTRLLETVAEAVHARPVLAPSGREDVTDPSVTSISSHPQFRAGLGPPPDDEFDHLGAVGDTRAVDEIAQAFRSDSKAALGYLAAAVDSADLQLFRSQVLALRGSANAIAATRLEALCHAGAAIESDSLYDKGKILVAQITREVDRVCEALRELC